MLADQPRTTGTGRVFDGDCGGRTPLPVALLLPPLYSVSPLPSRVPPPPPFSSLAVKLCDLDAGEAEEDSSVGSWEAGSGGFGSASTGNDDAAACVVVVHRAAPVAVEDGSGIDVDAVVVSRSGGVLWTIEAVVVAAAAAAVVEAVSAVVLPGGAEMLLVIRLPLPSPLLLPLGAAVALPGVAVAVAAAAAAVLAKTGEFSEAPSPSRAVTATAWAAWAAWTAKSSDADGAAGAAAFPAGGGAALDDGAGDAADSSTTPATSLPPDAGAATPVAAAGPAGAVDAEKSAMLPIMYSETTRGSNEDSGSRMTPSSAECAKELSAELAPGVLPAVAAVATEATAVESEEGTPPRFRPPEGCRESMPAGASKAKTRRSYPDPRKEWWGNGFGRQSRGAGEKGASVF